MNFISWFILYLALLFLEISVLPNFFTAAGPAISLYALALGLAWLDFRAGLWLAAAGGLMRDILSPIGVVPQTLVIFTVFFAIHLFRISAQWDEPLGRIAGAAVGLAAIIPGWVVASLASSVLFDLPMRAIGWADITNRLAIQEMAAAALGFLGFAVLMGRRSRRSRARKLTYI
ncbi:MAG: hypothetical protein AAB650_00875 [Patescibacteria group bacterium]